MPLEEFHTMALAARPDLKAALQAVEKAGTDHRLAVANGSTDPTFAMDLGAQSAHPRLHRVSSVNIPLRIFDRNQGEKARTANRHRACPAAEGRGPGAGVQRRGFGLLSRW